jgi:hypothetical protein
MIHVEYRKRIHLMLRTTGCLTTIALLYASVPGFWSSDAWGQQSPPQLNSPARAQTEPRRPVAPRPAPAAQPAFLQPSALNVAPIALPVPNSETALGTALLSCNKEAEGYQPASLPGARGEIKLDQCFRGRAHLVCSFNALLSEAQSLLEDYTKIVEANYPAIGSVEDVCRKTPEGLATDLERSSDFATRFHALKVQYDARYKCSNRVEESFRDVTLSDMAQAPSLLKSIIDSIEGDIKGVSAVQSRLAELADKMDSSHKAILTIQKIHRVMCVRVQQPARAAEGGGTVGTPLLLQPTLLQPTGPFMNR